MNEIENEKSNQEKPENAVNKDLEDQEQKTEYKKKAKKKKEAYWVWTIKIFFLAFALSMFFGILSELFMTGTGVALAIVMVLIFIMIAVITDMIGVAVLACDETPFKSMASRKIRGAKQGLFLIKNSAKIASLCADVVGDVCGVLSGAGGASVLVYLINGNTSPALAIIIASLVSALIAGLTIGGKAMFKQYATNNSTKVVLFIGKILSIFSRKQTIITDKDKNKDKKENLTKIENVNTQQTRKENDKKYNQKNTIKTNQKDINKKS